jgi:hypothetical protein
MNGTKLDLNKPFVPAATQLQDATHRIFTGQTYYYKTAAPGSGTVGYNTTFASPTGGIVRSPGWTAADLVRPHMETAPVSVAGFGRCVPEAASRPLRPAAQMPFGTYSGIESSHLLSVSIRLLVPSAFMM